MTTLNKTTNYQLADRHPARRSNSKLTLVARWTGEVRPVREGEWYLSGAVVAAYCAARGTRDAYPIAKICQVVTKTFITELEN